MTELAPHRHHYHQGLDGVVRYMGHWHGDDDVSCRDPECPDTPDGTPGGVLGVDLTPSMAWLLRHREDG